MITVDLDPAAVELPDLPALRVRSWFIDGVSPEAPRPFRAGLPTAPVEFLAQLPVDELSCWVRGTSGLVGFGRAVRLRTRGTAGPGAVAGNGVPGAVAADEAALPSRFTVLDRAWRALVASARIDDGVGLPGAGLVGFTALAFSPDSRAHSVIDVPRYLMGRRDGRVWLTDIAPDGDNAAGLALAASPLRAPVGARVLPGSVSAQAYRANVAQASATMRGTSVIGTSAAGLPETDASKAGGRVTAFGTGAHGSPGAAASPGTVGSPGESGGAATAGGAGAAGEAGRLRKAVLARDAVVETVEDIDVRAVLGRLNADYPSCWTFDVAGLVGATPELLIGVQDGTVTSRVLAGTYRVQRDPAAELDAARAQLGAAKDSAEHRFAINSLAASLGPLSPDLHVDAEPHLLQLSNVIHLASDARGTLAPTGSAAGAGSGGAPGSEHEVGDGEAAGAPAAPPSILEVARRVHPTAAVGGVPPAAAAALIADLEGADRGRYAGPVGWLDDRGNGQLGIALRCGQLEARNRIRLWAGAGIMPDSDPDSELAETAAKLAPMLRALGARLPDEAGGETGDTAGRLSPPESPPVD
ncbi:chorismate-binding protein [Brevibacterium sp. BRM-1]|uniref:isochorismate synthase n=1 Tax=Brevibacterium sp. BRM-1 TaxID=2999062 RepID=UPI002281D943|nr:chorismate-binding protein [Brevibacterium sp. BRM-1]WAL41556.1 chorismate-binding protein [Brevibacterium sp. BRM-1]